MEEGEGREGGGREEEPDSLPFSQSTRRFVGAGAGACACSMCVV